METSEIRQMIFDLVSAPGVSGDELGAVSTAKKYLCRYGSAETDSLGSLIGKIGGWKGGRPLALLDAHIDEIGYIVTYITDDGFLKIAGCGGIDNRLLPAQEVVILGKKAIHGVITSVPPHLQKDTKSVPDISEIYVDTGFTADECKELVSLGDRVVISGEPARLQGDRITSRALDDRCGAAAVLLALDMLSGKDLPFDLAVQFTSQEETGESGAKAASYTIQPDFAVAVDVSFGFTADDSEQKCGKLGEGPMIGFSPSLDRKMSEALVDTAKQLGIPYQIEVMSGRTGTNADAISVSGKGAKAVTLSVPLKYMHTPVEVISIKDIENTAKLLAGFLESGAFLK